MDATWSVKTFKLINGNLSLLILFNMTESFFTQQGIIDLFNIS